MLGGAVAAYAYDGAQKDKIADGVTVAGVDLSGMNREEATQALTNQVLAPQRKPVTVTFKKEKFQLPAKQLKIHANVQAAINQAFDESRDGSLPSRVFREITGAEVQASIPVNVGYSQKAVNRFVKKVADGIVKEPVDASVSAGPDSLSVVKAENGYKLRDNKLTDQLTSLLDSGRGSRTIVAKVNVTKPAVTTAEVAEKYPTYLTLDRSNFTLTLWKNLEKVKSYTVAVGQVGLETPAGLYSIQDKQVDPVWTVPNSAWAGDMAGQVVPGGVPENPLKARWMGIFDGAGIHGTDETYSLGSAASHGCVRMSVPDVIDLYDRVDVGTPIYIG
ncbi:MAG TPA: L,D-transpeptidase family protein [Solirubrobacterales bacterium]|nr:L,D-transpeptidase family protein [Solirubrobacterales bacterium]HMW44688.1 L,D-transpeptidase family protein [Solirubrobacterales bacterium]HNA23463.1 L,D-transpeptidase family protein [Solirubrobacterales bacterium]HNC04774.1 L,D-transpeptidase family protein [Solirubrobacterales bacterium]HNC93308.1 L,D-transpeptidase family protein [Solirubrobacterales bacterium]